MKLIISIVMLYCAVLPATAQVVKGLGDFSSHKLQSQPADLYGEWEFVWGKLKTPATFEKGDSIRLITAPRSWHRQGYEILGSGTYRCRLKLPGNQSGLSIYFPIINSAAKFFVNGVAVAETGSVGDSDLYHPRLLSTLVPLPDHEKDIELVIQVSNYTYFSGGIAATPQLGTSTYFVAAINRSNGIENFFAGSLIAMFLYQLILYFLYHRGKPYLWLSLICLGVALRALIVHGGSFLLPNLFSDVHWEFWKKIEFGSVYAIVALFPLYVFHLFPGHAPRKPMIVFIALALCLCIPVIVLPQYIYGKLLEICHVGLLFGFIYAVYSISRAWRAGNEDARIILFGVLASFPFILAEIMKNSRFFPVNIAFMYLVEMGVLVFLLFQVYLLANHYAKSYKNLENMNQNLERLVEERSGELITANAVKDRLLSVMSHDIKSPLNSLRGILHIYNQGAIAEHEMKEYTAHIENDLSVTTNMVENILYWTSSQIKGVQVKIETFNLMKVIDENIQLFSTLAAFKKISIISDLQDDFPVRSDVNIVNLVVRNLISNAIKFSHENTEVHIRVAVRKKILMIEVHDSGVGMDEDKLATLLAPELTVSSKGTSNEKGTGLGLALCREYLQKIEGNLEVTSEKGKGSVFTISLARY